MVGISFPGIEHKPKITNAHSMASVYEYFFSRDMTIKKPPLFRDGCNIFLVEIKHQLIFCKHRLSKDHQVVLHR
mgnify:CR=1 FL=1